MQSKQDNSYVELILTRDVTQIILYGYPLQIDNVGRHFGLTFHDKQRHCNTTIDVNAAFSHTFLFLPIQTQSHGVFPFKR